MIQQSQHIFKGMQRDLAVSRSGAEFVFEAQNIRLTARENNTLLSVTNEKGNKEIEITGDSTSIEGTVIGHTVLNSWLILFTTDNSTDRIYRLNREDDVFNCTILFEGSLNFNTSNPIESIGIYETEEIQKIYWVDGINQPRMINILKTYGSSNKFDFVQELALNETITVERNETSNGSFPAGVVQYAFSYYNKYGQESLIFYTTPICYISYTTRGASAEDTVTCSFTITIENPDTNFDYIRIYSILRTSIDAEPTVKQVIDIKITGDTITYTDTNTTGETLDSTALLYIGGEKLVAYTMAHKDNTLFLGNLNLETEVIDEDIRESLRGLTISFEQESTGVEWNNNGVYYEYVHPLKYDAGIITSFKYGETYRFGLQFQNNTGKWSEVVYVGDYEITEKPYLDYHTDPLEETSEQEGSETTEVMIYRVKPSFIIPSDIRQRLYDTGWIRVRGVCVYPSANDRTVVAQGIICPTVFRLGDRNNNAPFAQSSWFARPSVYWDKNTIYNPTTIASPSSSGYNYHFAFDFSNTGWNVTSNGQDYDDFFNTIISNGYTVSLMQGPRTIDGITIISYEHPSDDDYDYARHRICCTVTESFEHEALPPIGFLYCASNGTYVSLRPDVDDSSINDYVLSDEYHTIGQGTVHVITPNWTTDWTNYGVTIVIGGVPTENSPAGVWTSEITNVIANDSTYVMDTSLYGEVTEFRHNFPIPNTWEYGGEVMTINNSLKYPLTYEYEGNDFMELVRQHENDFYVDQNIVTFHSPDVEFDDNVLNMSNTSLKFRIVGYVKVDASKGAYTLTSSGGTYGENELGWFSPEIGSTARSVFGSRYQSTGAHWIDEMYDANLSDDNTKSFAFVTHVWHRNGSLNNDHTRESDEDGERTAVLESKVLSNLKFCGATTFLDTPWEAYVEGDEQHTGITPIQVFNSDEVTNVRLTAPANSPLSYINYYGNIDTVLSPTMTGGFGIIQRDLERNASTYGTRISYTSYENSQGVPIAAAGYDADDSSAADAYEMFGMTRRTLHAIKNTSHNPITNTCFSMDPVPMKYNSTPHIVFAFNYTTSNFQVAAPTNYAHDESDTSSSDVALRANYTGFGITYGMCQFLWNVPNLNGTKEFNTADYDTVQFQPAVYQDCLEIQKPEDTYRRKKYSYLWLGELYRDEVLNRFGGDTDEAMLNNIWYPAGEPVRLDTDAEVEFTTGDTFLSRYDCLKTYSNDSEATNGVVEIVSFLCETRVNIDGRYDRNRGQLDNTTMSTTNFNLMNDVYSQKDSYFTQSTIDYDTFSNDSFPNTIIWSEEKTSADEIDTWTGLNMASSLELDGDKGWITSLNVFNNEIYCFQRTGFSNILFNSRVQIPSSDGVAIEITNGLKVSGKRYISNTIGCQNKWSIFESPLGIYFIDNLTNAIYLFNNQITNLSGSLGFTQWISANNSLDVWNPVDYSNFVTFYDKGNNDVYFTNGNTSLVYSEVLQQFISFMDYQLTEAMFSLDDAFYAIKDGKIWENFEGEYNMFFGEFKPYYITFIDNNNPSYDKIYNNLEYRADCWTKDEEGNEILASYNTFDNLEVWDEYQKGTLPLTFRNCKPSSLKKKFRVWRANIPRANTLWNGVEGNGRDRIRNTWSFIKLSREEENTDRMEFHDVVVKYFL